MALGITESVDDVYQSSHLTDHVLCGEQQVPEAAENPEDFFLAGCIAAVQLLYRADKIIRQLHIHPLHAVALNDGHEIPHKRNGIRHKAQHIVLQGSHKRGHILFAIGLVIVLVPFCIHDGFQNRIQHRRSNNRADCPSHICLIPTGSLENSVVDHVDGRGRLRHKRGRHAHQLVLAAHIPGAGEHAVIYLGLGDDLREPLSADLQELLRPGCKLRMLRGGLPLHGLPDGAPGHLVRVPGCHGKQLVEGAFLPLGNARQDILDTVMLRPLDVVHGGFSHVGIEVAHVLDSCHGGILLDDLPGWSYLLPVDDFPGEILWINQGRGSHNGAWLLDDHGRAGKHCVLLEQVDGLGNERCSRVNPRPSVDALDQLPHRADSFLPHIVLKRLLQGYRGGSFLPAGLVIDDPVKILNGQHKSVVVGHLVHMVGPYIHEIPQYNRVV